MVSTLIEIFPPPLVASPGKRWTIHDRSCLEPWTWANQVGECGSHALLLIKAQFCAHPATCQQLCTMANLNPLISCHLRFDMAGLKLGMSSIWVILPSGLQPPFKDDMPQMAHESYNLNLSWNPDECKAGHLLTTVRLRMKKKGNKGQVQEHNDFKPISAAALACQIFFWNQMEIGHYHEKWNRFSFFFG